MADEHALDHVDHLDERGAAQTECPLSGDKVNVGSWPPRAGQPKPKLTFVFNRRGRPAWSLRSKYTLDSLKTFADLNEGP